MKYAETAKYVSSLCQINLFFFNEDNELTGYEGRCENLSFLPARAQIAALRDECARNGGALICSDEGYFLYGAIQFSAEEFMLCGPCCSDENYNRKKFRFQEIYHISLSEVGTAEFNAVRLSEFLAVAAAALDGSVLSPNRILAAGESRKEKTVIESVQDYRSRISEQEIFRYGEKTEETFFHIIKEGREEELLASLENGYPGQIEYIGDFAESEIKKMEYMFVTSLAITRRAAVKGGMKYETAVDLSDIYLKKVEKCKTVQEIYTLFTEMQKQYVHMVRLVREKERKNVYVEFCMDEMCRNLTKPFKRGELAGKLGVSPGYLSVVFKQETGMSLTEFWTGARLSAAKNMLKYSDAPVTAIAARFHFSSPGRFSQAFRDMYGMSPSEYRKENKIFVSE